MLNKFQKLILLGVSFFALFFMPVMANALELQLDAIQKSVIDIDNANVYKPSKLFIGSKNSFIIKGEPNSIASIVIALDNLGKNVIATAENQINDKGILELEIEIPENKDLINKIAYFEVIIWKNSDRSDAHVARVVSSDGKHTATNTVIIANKQAGKYLPGFNPAGIGTVSDTVDSMNSDLEYGDDAYYYNKPLIIRNLRAPELNEK